MVNQDNDGFIFLAISRRFDGHFYVEITKALAILYTIRKAFSRDLSLVECESLKRWLI